MIVCLERPSVEKVRCYKSVIIAILGNGEAEGLGGKDHVTLPPWRTENYLQRHLRFLNQNKFGLKQPLQLTDKFRLKHLFYNSVLYLDGVRANHNIVQE